MLATAQPEHGWKMSAAHQTETLSVFPTALGWMAMLGADGVLKGLSLAHPGAEAARDAMADRRRTAVVLADWNLGLRARLEAYARGAEDRFLDVEVELGSRSSFSSRVIACCRQIPFGQTRTYGQLAVEAGHRGAARAVGNCMAGNPIPLVIPCHRVVAAGGRLGGFSAPGGVQLKQRLLQLEAARLKP